MSRITLIPRLFSHWWEALERPHRLLDQHFATGLTLDQLFHPALFERRYPFVYERPTADLFRQGEGGWSVVKADKDKFLVALDIQQFKPDEVKVKLVDKFVVVEGKHEEKQDEHGIISRQFIRKYMIPEQCDAEQVTSSLSSDGVLTITAPRKPGLEQPPEKEIKIEHTGKPATKPAIEENTEGNDKK